MELDDSHGHAPMGAGDDVDNLTPAMDDDDNKENVVEVHLSSANNYAIPGSSTSNRPVAHIKREPSVKREHSPPELDRKTVIKRETTPITEVRLSSKNNYAIPNTADAKPTSIKKEPHVKTEPAEHERLEIRTKRGMKTEPADNDPYRTKAKKVQRVKPEPTDDTMPIEIKKEPDVRVKTEPTEDMLKAGLTKSPKQEEPPPVSWDEEEETLVEIHLSSRCQYSSTKRVSVKTEALSHKPMKKESSPFVLPP
ncbi:hypothetical protein C8Q76DRAFT_799263 [Earliella scabrosa]|nr:hypothetical protein C8Q76DRAFT_799263 [Earliella scabrosa]